MKEQLLNRIRGINATNDKGLVIYDLKELGTVGNDGHKEPWFSLTVTTPNNRSDGDDSIWTGPGSILAQALDIKYATNILEASWR